MKRLPIISLFMIIACEEVVVVELPRSQNLIVVEGWISDRDEPQSIKLSRSNGFSDEVPVVPITDANVVIQTRTGSTFNLIHDKTGLYVTSGNLRGVTGSEYRVRIQLPSGEEIRSNWERLPVSVPINDLTVESFEENDPDNSNQQITVYYPKINASDPAGINNFYRWIFYKNGVINSEPESITIQDDRFFDGNLIPNNYQQFGYDQGDEIVVEFQSISQDAYEYLRLLKSQITTLGTSTGTTPATVTGNLFYNSEEQRALVLGYFGAIAISSDTIVVE